MKTQSLSSNVTEKEGLPTPDLGSLPPAPGAGVHSHGYRPQQLQDALPVPLLGCMELLGADADNLRPGDKDAIVR